MMKHMKGPHVLRSKPEPQTEVEVLKDVSFLFQKANCEHQRNGFRQVRMAGMRKCAKKKMLKQKDGERNLHFSPCPPDAQAALRETRRVEWKKWTSFNAGVFLTEEEVRRLSEASCEIYPMKWVDTDKNAVQEPTCRWKFRDN